MSHLTHLASRISHLVSRIPHPAPLFTIYCLLITVLLACDLSTITTLIPSNASKPVTIIQSPPSNSEFREGEEVAIQSQSTDKSGIARIELIVDDVIAREDTPPLAGQESFSLVQRWSATAGTHTISVRAFNAKGAMSDAASIVVNVLPAAKPTAAPTQQALATLTLPTITSSGATPTLTRAATSPTRSPTPRAQPTNTPDVPSGVYGISVRLDPPEPKRAQFVTFYVTFLNTTGEPKAYRWFIKIFEPDKANSFGETSKKQEDIPVGRSELASPADWRIVGPGPCQQYFARVFWTNPETKEVFEFTKPDFGGGPAAGFQVCP